MNNIGMVILSTLVLVIPIKIAAAQEIPEKSDRRITILDINDRNEFLVKYDPLQTYITDSNVTNIIREYAGPYAWPSYMNIVHKESNRDIIYTHMSPGEIALATYGEDPLSEQKGMLYLHRADNLCLGPKAYYLDVPFVDCSWSPDITKIALSDATGYDYIVPTELFFFDQKKERTYVKSVIQKDKSTFALRGYQNHASVGLIIQENEPNIPVVRDVISYKPSHPSEDNASLTDIAFIDEQYYALFFKERNLLLVKDLSKSEPHLIYKISAVDFSSYYSSVVGDIAGEIHYQISEEKLEIVKAFNNKPISLLSACKDFIAARAVMSKEIKIFSCETKQCVATFTHKGSVKPSIIKVAPDGSALAYAAGRALHIMSIKAAIEKQGDEKHKNQELKRHIFTTPITWMHYGKDNSIYLTHGGTLLKIMP